MTTIVAANTAEFDARLRRERAAGVPRERAAGVPRERDTAARPGALRRFARTPKGLLTLLFIPLLGLASANAGWGVALPHLLAAIAGACLTDAVAQRLYHRHWAWPVSALLSGAIVGAVLGLETAWWVTFAVGAMASASKHVLRLRHGHIFNPAALAVLLSVPLFATDHSWWGALPDLPAPFVLVLLAIGAVVVDRIDKFPLALTFSAVYFALFTVVGVLNPVRAAEMFREPFVHAALFCALFMLTDPPTAPGKHLDQVWIGALVAVACVVAQLGGVGQSYLLVGLLVGNVAWAVRRRLAAPQHHRALTVVGSAARAA